MAQQWPFPPGANFAYTTAVRALEEQLKRIEALDAKSGIIMAADGVLIGLLFRANSILASIPRFWGSGAAGLVLISILLALVSFLNRRYRTAPAPGAAITLMGAPSEWLEWRFLGNMAEALAINERKLTWKARFLTGAMTSLFLGVLIVGVYFVRGVWDGSIKITIGG